MAHQGMASTLEAPDMRAGYDNPEQVPLWLTYPQQPFRPGLMPTLSATSGVHPLDFNVGIGCRGGCNESAEQRRLAGISPPPSVPPISPRKQFTPNAGAPNPRLPRPHSRANPDAGFVRPRQREVPFAPASADRSQSIKSRSPCATAGP